MSSLTKSPLDFNMMVSDYTKGGLPDIPKIFSQKQVSLLKKELGHKTLIKFIYALLADLCKSYNIGKGMDESQLIEAATNLVEDFYGFRLVDFAICFRKAKKGIYGKVYDRMDMATVYEFLNKYDNERTQQIISHRMRYKEGIIDSPRVSTQERDIRKDETYRKVFAEHLQTIAKRQKDTK